MPMSMHTAFKKSVQFLSAKEFPLPLSDGDKLVFYGTYKQAMVGPCTLPQPPAVSVVARAKWSAWSRLGPMPKEEAEKLYVRHLDSLRRTWMKVLTDEELKASLSADLAFLDRVKGR